MTFPREQIIEWAREAGLEVHPRKEQVRVGIDALMGIDSTEKVARFASLIEQAVRTDENEACAQVCDDFDVCDPKHIADAIRARITNQPADGSTQLTPKTGWPPGMLQDDDRRLSRWLASRPGARYQVRKNIMEMTDKQTDALRLADELLAMFGPTEIDERIAAELRRLHAENEKFKDANITLMERIDRRDARIAALEQAGRTTLENICGAKLCEINSMSSRGEMVRLIDSAVAHLRQALGEDA